MWQRISKAAKLRVTPWVLAFGCRASQTQFGSIPKLTLTRVVQKCVLANWRKENNDDHHNNNIDNSDEPSNTKELIVDVQASADEWASFKLEKAESAWGILRPRAATSVAHKIVFGFFLNSWKHKKYKYLENIALSCWLKIVFLNCWNLENALWIAVENNKKI